MLQSASRSVIQVETSRLLPSTGMLFVYCSRLCPWIICAYPRAVYQLLHEYGQLLRVNLLICLHRLA